MDEVNKGTNKKQQLKLITLTSDFEKQSRGVGSMEAVAYEICPDAKVIHLAHGIPDFGITEGANILETIKRSFTGGVGNYHVCVVDPGVGTPRKAIIIKTKRGDHFIGPDNGVLIPAARLLGIEKVVQITNQKYMRQPVSPIFHGRDVFTPAAAHLASGVAIESFGPEIAIKDLTPPPYEDAKVLMKGKDGKESIIEAQVIHISKFGSLGVNIVASDFDQFPLKLKEKCNVIFKGVKSQTVPMMFATTFGEVPQGNPLIMKDDYGRLEIAVNCGSFAEKYGVKMKDKITITKV